MLRECSVKFNAKCKNVVTQFRTIIQTLVSSYADTPTYARLGPATCTCISRPHRRAPCHPA